MINIRGFSMYAARETPGVVKWKCAVYCRRFAHNKTATTLANTMNMREAEKFWTEWPHDLSDAYGTFMIRETVEDAYTDLTKLKMGSMASSSVYSPFVALVVEVIDGKPPTTIFRRMEFAIDESQSVVLDKEKLSK
ncbi:MAG TPA: hypothetical protein VFI76_08920 [Terrimicrobiaceae bacterium]|nr:hypothetical protein [Terrimicrobiaceae bacterium]